MLDTTNRTVNNEPETNNFYINNEWENFIMNDKSINEIIIDCLNEFKSNIDTLLKTGLCSIMDNNTSTGPRKYIHGYQDLFHSWKHFSGDPVYPVPDPTGNSESHRIYYDFVSAPKYSGKYGELRLDLLDHIIEECERQNEILLEMSDDIKLELSAFVKSYYTSDIEKGETDMNVFLEKHLTKESIHALIQLFSNDFIFEKHEDEKGFLKNTHRVVTSIGRIIQ